MSSWIGIGDELPAEVSPDERGFAYGDGLFETIAIRQGKARFWPYHCERLLLGCMRLGIAVPTEPELWQSLSQAIAKESSGCGTLKLLYTRGEGPRGYRPPNSPRPRLWLKFWPEDCSAIECEEGASIELQFAEMPLARQSALAGMKHLNRLEQVLGGKNASEALFCDTHQNVVCGRMSNVFFVTGGRLCTPGLSHSGVAGIARRAVLQVAHASGLDVKVADFGVSEVVTADEVFLCNSRYLIRPVRALAGRTLNLGPHTRHLSSLVQALAKSL